MKAPVFCIISGTLFWVPGPSDAHANAAPRRDAAITTVGQANQAAVLQPSRSQYISAMQVYPWSEGALYRLYASPGQVSDLALEPGEGLIAVAAGDTTRWIIGDTSSGAGAAKRVHILAKPSTVGLSTNMVITTDRRSYHLALTSTAHTAMAAVSWTYPADALISLKASVDPSQGSGPGDNPPSLAVDRLNFGYRIAGDAPWRPLRAFDDGRQTFIEFPPAISAGEAPPLFIVGAKGAPELVNYRMQGRFYVVDRLFDRAELRLGVKPQKIVRIIRDGSGPSGARAS
jgi:P-type conjugative transfer protein TrbG